MGVSPIISSMMIHEHRNVSKPALWVILRVILSQHWDWRVNAYEIMVFMKMFDSDFCSPAHDYLWHRSPSVSCSWDPCKHLRGDLESSWAENRTLCTRTNPFPVQHDIKDKSITNTCHITARVCTTEQVLLYVNDWCDVLHVMH